MTWLGYAATLHFAAHTIGAGTAVYVLDSTELAHGSETSPRSERDAPRSARVSAPDPRLASRERAATEILGYDPFCPECVEAPAADPALAQAARFAPYGENATLGPLLQPGESPTALPLDLIATMEAAGDGLSLATIRHEVRGVGVFARGDEILPQVEVVRVGHGIVHLRNNGTVEYLALEPPEPAKSKKKKKKSSKKKKKKKKKKNKYAIEGADDAIDCSKDHACKIDRSFVEMLIAKPALLARQGRMRPHKRDGKMAGFRLSGARKGTLPRLLGLRSGDILTEINGQALTSVDSAFGLFGKLRHASHLDLTVERRGKTMQMSFDIV